MMAKRRRRCCSKRNTKVKIDNEDGRDQHISIDRISMLPDELLVSILSRLTFEELTATSILSRRWRSLWTLVPKLDFDGTKSLSKIQMAENQKLAMHEERSMYVRWVDRVIEEHKSCAIEDFRVHFNLTKFHSGYINKWVKYALDRKVKRLEMDLTHTSDVFSLRSCCNCYTFPYRFLHQYKENCPSSIHFKYLEKISMTHVNVNGEALEFFLSNCPLLQHLSVSESKELSNLKIIGPFPSLTHLEIVSCLNLDSIEIRDVNLVYLKYIGENIQQFVLKNVPHLAEIYTGGTMRITNVVSMFSSILPQLEKFKLVIGCWLSWEETEMLYSAVKMSNLKQLIVSPYFEGSLLPLSNIIRASPCLETLVIEIPLRGTRFGRTELVKKEASYTNLKNVKFIGYCGSTSDLEFVMHLSECAGALENIVIDPCKPVDTPGECFWKNNYEAKNRRKRNASVRAKRQLVGKLPPRINLQIL